MTKFPKDITDKYAMTEDRFWQLVGFANWPNDGYEGPNAMYRSSLSKEEGIEFRKIVYALWGLLDHEIGERNPAGGSDDSHSDFCYHIIGLGRKQFYTHLNDYSLMEARGVAGDYKESFGYAVPYEDDWEKKDIREDELLEKEETVFEYAEVLNSISDCLANADGEFVADIYNKVCSDQIEYKGDSIWKVVKND